MSYQDHIHYFSLAKVWCITSSILCILLSYPLSNLGNFCMKFYYISYQVLYSYIRRYYPKLELYTKLTHWLLNLTYLKIFYLLVIVFFFYSVL